MAKNEISDYDETDSGNTDISGITLSDATLIDQLDNIARAQMGALKRWFKSSLFRLRDSTDQTKLLAFDLSGIATGTTRTVAFPNGSGTVVYEAQGQTLTNKTLTTPTITLKQGASPTPTAEGDIQWNSNNNLLVVGDGSNTQTFHPQSSNAFTPTLNFNAGTTGIAYATRTGFYIRTGRMVTVWIHILLTSKGSSGGAARISGLPVTPSTADVAIHAGTVGFSSGLSGITAGASCIIDGGHIKLYGGTSGGWTALTDANVSDTSEFVLSVSYPVAL